jgi:4-deoxy-L-threo-5-hexosulose-uronate ketol-isomerase
METRHPCHPDHVRAMDAATLRRHFLIEDLFRPGELRTVYSHVDRVITGGAFPTAGALELSASRELGVAYFLERRELGILNLGGPGVVRADGQDLALGTRDALYVGKGTRQVSFLSKDPASPARFYFLSAPAHAAHPTRVVTMEQAKHVKLGSAEQSNARTIHQLIHPAVLPTCQLVIGLTQLEPGSVWNTMPAHTHERRMEVYLYLDLPADAFVLHLMGTPDETRHLVVRNEQAVISPSWSIHSGCGTRAYSFIWGMAGENQTFDDMDAVAMPALR